MGWRTGAPRPPSDIRYSVRKWKRGGTPRAASLPTNDDGLLAERVERLLEAAGMRFLGLRERLEPVGDLVEAFLAGGLRHAGIHVGVFMCLAGNRRSEILIGRADRLAGRRIADFLQVFEMAVRMAGLAFRGRAEHGRDVVVAFDIRLLCEIEIAAVRLALAGEGLFQIRFRLTAL